MTAPTTEVRCQLTELIASQCAHCRGHRLEPEVVQDGPVRVRVGTGTPSWAWCRVCDGEIARGQRFARLSTGGFAHEVCLP